MEKFTSRKQAEMYAKLETIRTHRKHTVVNTQYMDMSTYEMVGTVAVIFDRS